jgi:hypothetical protein
MAPDHATAVFGRQLRPAGARHAVFIILDAEYIAYKPAAHFRNRSKPEQVSRHDNPQARCVRGVIPPLYSVSE